MIEQLQGSKPAHVQLEFPGGFQCGGTQDIWVVGDGTAVFTGSTLELGTYAYRAAIRAGVNFDECLAPNAEASSLNRCLTQWYLPSDICEAPVCCPGGGGGDGELPTCEAQ